MCQKIPVEADFLYAYSTAPGEKPAKKGFVAQSVSMYLLAVMLAVGSLFHAVADYSEVSDFLCITCCSHFLEKKLIIGLSQM